jgi:nucleoside-diphosphate-sugar epimerase
MPTILVTGASGFAGSHALQALAAQLAGRDDIRLIAACRDATRLPAGFSGEVRAGDLRDPAYLAGLLDGVDTLVQAAAWSSLWGHEALSRALYLEPSLALIEAARQAGVARIVNVSSTSAAAPLASADALSPGIPRRFWPHLCNVIQIEETLRELAASDLSVVNLRLGIFVGQRYSLGVLPILLPRLKTHLVPWVAGGRTGLPLIDGRDVGQALALAATAPHLHGYEAFNVVGPKLPTVREVLSFLHHAFGYPTPHFSVPFAVAYPFAWLMEKLDPLLPWEPLVTRSIVHLLEDTGADNRLAEARLGYRAQHHWQDAIRVQLAEMAERQHKPMAMIRPVA